MTNSTIVSSNGKEQEIWSSLRQAIAKSSGFKSWQQERGLNGDVELEQQVKCYLKETLETLAY